MVLNEGRQKSTQVWRLKKLETLMKLVKRIKQASIVDIISSLKLYVFQLSRIQLCRPSADSSFDQVHQQASIIFEALRQKVSLLRDLGRIYLISLDQFKKNLKLGTESLDIELAKEDNQIAQLIAQYQNGVIVNASSTSDRYELAVIKKKIKNHFSRGKEAKDDAEKLAQITPNGPPKHALKRNNKQEYFQIAQAITCLGCRRYFHNNTQGQASSGVQTGIPAEELGPRSNFKCYMVKNYESYNNQANRVRACIHAFLNEPRGGVVLVGCEQKQGVVYAQGIRLSEKDKDSLQRKILSGCNNFYPKVHINVELLIDFVPIIEKRKTQKCQKYYVALTQMYVCRIVVRPRHIYKLYVSSTAVLETQAEPKDTCLEKLINREPQTIYGTQIYGQAARKFHTSLAEFSFHGLKDEDGFSKGYWSHYVYNIHYCLKCEEPLVGQYGFEQPAYTKPAPAIDQSYESSKFFPPAKTPAHEDSKNKYKYCALIVVDSKGAQQLNQLFRKEGKRAEIEKCFAEKKFKLTKTTWVLRHEDKFEKIKNLIEKTDVVYNNKKLNLIACNNYLATEMLPSSFPEQDKVHLRMYVQEQNRPADSFKVGIHKQNKHVLFYFFEIMDAIYAYFYLSSNKLKAKFIRGATYFQESADKKQSNQSYLTVLSEPVPQPAQAQQQSYGTSNMGQIYSQHQPGYNEFGNFQPSSGQVYYQYYYGPDGNLYYYIKSYGNQGQASMYPPVQNYTQNQDFYYSAQSQGQASAQSQGQASGQEGHKDDSKSILYKPKG